MLSKIDGDWKYIFKINYMWKITPLNKIKMLLLPDSDDITGLLMHFHYEISSTSR